MITSKQRAYLRGLANTIDPIFQIGKGGITDIMVREFANALEAREIIKIHVLETSFLNVKTACNEIAEKLRAEPVQAIGSKITIYKQADEKKNRKIELPRK